jgi:hypothetical protein
MTGRDETITLCTPHSMDSIYIDWINNKGFKPLIIPSEYPSDVNIYGGNLAPYIVERMKANPSIIGSNVDERFTLDILGSKAKRIGKSQYKLQYMLDVTASDELKHPLKLADLIVMDIDIDSAPIKISPSSMHENRVMIKHNGFSTDKLYSPSYVSEERAEYNYRVMALDPSGRGEDETGLAVGFTSGGRIFLKKVTGIQGGYEYDTLEAIAQMCADYKIDYLVIESNFGDGIFAKIIEPVLLKKSPSTQIESVRATKQKELRVIGTLEPLLNQRKVVIDKQVLDDDLKANIVNSFAYQLTRITKERGCLRHDDRVDAVEMLCSFISDKENMDEDAVATGYEQAQLEKDLEELMQQFDFNYQSNNNFGSVF